MDQILRGYGLSSGVRVCYAVGSPAAAGRGVSST